VPKDHVLLDPWSGEPLRDPEGNLIVDWTGTTQWETYRKNMKAAAGPRYGALEKDSRLYGSRSRFVTTYRYGFDGAQPSGWKAGTPYEGRPIQPNTIKAEFASISSPIEHQLGIITPAGLHYVDEHGEVPEIDPRQHRLTIFGMVDRPLTFTMDDLMRLPSVSRVHTVECNSDGARNNRKAVQPWSTPGYIFSEMSCSEWTGVPLSKLLEMVGVQKGASWFLASAADEYNQTVSLPLWKAMDDALIAYGQNGEPVRPENGFPLRLLVPGFQGTNNIKRLRRIKITDAPADFHRESHGYTEMLENDKVSWFRFEMPPKSCILRPSAGMQVPDRGFYEIRGIAWSGGGKITRVEVTIDGGKSWKDAEVQGPVNSKAHTRFVFPWSWTGEETIIASRCTDERGSIQPTAEEYAKIAGKAGTRLNLVQLWKIDRDGKVTNGNATLTI
jgi:sulfane dehydrogenase subunit SoxC